MVWLYSLSCNGLPIVMGVYASLREAAVAGMLSTLEHNRPVFTPDGVKSYADFIRETATGKDVLRYSVFEAEHNILFIGALPGHDVEASALYEPAWQAHEVQTVDFEKVLAQV